MSKEKTWTSPTETFIKNLDAIVQSGITKEDKEFLLDELDEMAQMLEQWKIDNPEESSIKKVS